jgi:hypothetical protein
MLQVLNLDRIVTTTSGPPPMIGSTSGTSSRRPGLVIVSGSSYKIQGIKSPVSGKYMNIF